MRKIARNSSNYYYSNTLPFSRNEQQKTTTGYLRQTIHSSSLLKLDHPRNEEQLISSTLRKKHLWMRSASKDG